MNRINEIIFKNFPNTLFLLLNHKVLILENHILHFLIVNLVRFDPSVASTRLLFMFDHAARSDHFPIWCDFIGSDQVWFLDDFTAGGPRMLTLIRCFVHRNALCECAHMFGANSLHRVATERAVRLVMVRVERLLQYFQQFLLIVFYTPFWGKFVGVVHRFCKRLVQDLRVVIRRFRI